MEKRTEREVFQSNNSIELSQTASEFPVELLNTLSLSLSAVMSLDVIISHARLTSSNE
jgi:hypothetical protein